MMRRANRAAARRSVANRLRVIHAQDNAVFLDMESTRIVNMVIQQEALNTKRRMEDMDLVRPCEKRVTVQVNPNEPITTLTMQHEAPLFDFPADAWQFGQETGLKQGSSPEAGANLPEN